MKNLIGIIESGKFKVRRILLGKKSKIDKKASKWWVEDGVFLNGSPKFTRACLKCETLNVPEAHKCKKSIDGKILTAKH